MPDPTRPAGTAIDVGLTVAPGEAARRARQLADVGVDGLFSFEGPHDIFLPLALAATTTDVDLMTNVAIAFPRSPVHLAHAAYDLQLLTGGRFRLGLGSQVRAHVERRYGATWSRPVARMREMVLAITSVLRAWEGEGPLAFEGEFTSHTYMPPLFNPGPNPFGRPPVLVGALGPRMTEVAAEVADGILVMPFNSRRHLEQRTLPALERGLARATRPPGTFEVICEAIVAVGATDEELAAARAGAKGLLAFYGSTPAYRPVLEVEGWADLQVELRALTSAGRWADMGSLIDDTMLETLAVVGTPDECARKISARFGGVAQRLCCYFPGYPVSDERIGELVSAVRARTRPPPPERGSETSGSGSW